MYNPSSMPEIPWAGAARIGFFAGILAVMALWELAAPKRAVTADRARRWPANIGVSALNAAVFYAAVPVPPILLAAVMRGRGMGLFNMTEANPVIALVGSLILLDFIIYLQHLMFHAVPLFWRLHMAHHSDLHIDATTGLRFHPLEILLSLVIKLAAVILIGPPPEAVLIFEIILNGTSMFNHGNVRIPGGLDRLLRLVVVTPDMHRVHHSVAIRETNSNFGFNLPWWDRILGTYRDQPAAGHGDMIIGISGRREPAGFLTLIRLPFTGDPGRYPIGGHGGDPGAGRPITR